MLLSFKYWSYFRGKEKKRTLGRFIHHRALHAFFSLSPTNKSIENEGCFLCSLAFGKWKQVFTKTEKITYERDDGDSSITFVSVNKWKARGCAERILFYIPYDAHIYYYYEQNNYLFETWVISIYREYINIYLFICTSASYKNISIEKKQKEKHAEKKTKKFKKINCYLALSPLFSSTVCHYWDQTLQ